jgi:hypothetical protein
MAVGDDGDTEDTERVDDEGDEDVGIPTDFGEGGGGQGGVLEWLKTGGARVPIV